MSAAGPHFPRVTDDNNIVGQMVYYKNKPQYELGKRALFNLVECNVE